MRLRSTLGPIALAGILATGGMLSGAPAAMATPAERPCIMLIRVYEDGSWGGSLARRADGSVLAERWDVTGPELQNTITPNQYGTPTYHTAWPPEIDGQRCQVWLDHRP